MHKATTRFWKCFDNLPNQVKELAKRNFNLLITDSKYPSLHFKKVGKFWSARVGSNYRALAVKDEEGFVWVWIGTHEDYERLIS